MHGFVSRATAELIWLNEKEEEELAYDWSDNNPNIAAKRNYFSVSERPGAGLAGWVLCGLLCPALELLMHLQLLAQVPRGSTLLPKSLSL